MLAKTPPKLTDIQNIYYKIPEFPYDTMAHIYIKRVTRKIRLNKIKLTV